MREPTEDSAGPAGHLGALHQQDRGDGAAPVCPCPRGRVGPGSPPLTLTLNPSEGPRGPLHAPVGATETSGGRPGDRGTGAVPPGLPARPVTAVTTRGERTQGVPACLRQAVLPSLRPVSVRDPPPAPFQDLTAALMQPSQHGDSPPVFTRTRSEECKARPGGLALADGHRRRHPGRCPHRAGRGVSQSSLSNSAPGPGSAHAPDRSLGRTG